KHHLATLPPAVHRALRQMDFRVMRKRAEEALLSSEERYRSLVELSPDALFVQSDGKIVFVNSAGVKLFVADKPEELIGKSALDFVHPDFRETVRERMRQLRDENRPVPFREQKVVRLDGAVVDVEIAAAPLAFEGKAAAHVIVHNITQSKHAE